MNRNNEFGLIIINNGTIKDASRTYINILNGFDNNENIVEINGSKYNLTLKQFQDIKKLIEKHLSDIIKISKEQTQTYLAENGLDGYGKNLTILLGGMQIYVDFAVANEKTKKIGSNLIDSLTKIFIN